MALALLLAGLGALTGVAATGKSAAFPVDLREGDRVSAGTEELTFSNLWDGDSEATVTIAQDGAAIFTGLSGEGVKTWSVDRNGRYVLTHTTYTNGIKGKVETAVFVAEGKEVPVGELTVEWESGSFMYDNNGKTPGVTAKDGDTLLVKGVDYTVRYEGNTNAGTAKAILTGLPPYVGSVTNEFAIAKRLVELTSGTDSKAYDGTPLVCHSVTTNGDGFVAGEGVDFAFTGSQTIVGSGKNTFDYTFKAGTLAGNYTITKTEGDLIVARANIVNPFDPDDPTNPATSEDLAKANCITNYDGDGHSVEVAAFLNLLIAANDPKITYSLLRDGTYEAQKPVFTNVVSTSVWYRIEADNFNMFTTNALLKILPRSIANVNVAAIADQTYTGFGVEPIPAVTDMRTLAGMSDPTDILSSADYDLSYLNNTNVGTAKVVLTGKNNYEGSQTNAFQIVPAIIPPGPTGAIVATGYTNAYDSVAHGVSVSVAGLKTQPTVQYKSSPSSEWQDESPTYADVCDTQVWWKVSAPNYQSVEGTIGLKIAQAENAWTVEPAIEGWTYGAAAKTPVGAAKFGEVSFAYSPATVGPAGDYTLTATVTGTANYTGLSKSVDFTIAKAILPPDVKPDPVDPDPTKPDGPYSAFDYVGDYDGEGHTIDTNGLVVAYRAAIGAGFAVSYAVGESGGQGQPATPWRAVAPVFTNAATNVVWYKVSSANYEDIVHPAKVAIVPRAITIASVGGTWTYDTVAHGTNEVEIVEKVEGVEKEFEFPEGEGIEVDEASFPTITDVGEKDNAFEWAFAEGTLEGNYAVTVKYGKLKVNARTIGDDDKNWDIRLDKAPMYNGEVQSAPIIQVCYVKPDGNLDYIPYELAGNTATDAGNYKVKISGKGNYSGTVEKDWAIMPRNLKLTSGTETWMYDGITHSNDTVTVTGDGFVEGEGATYAGFPEVLHFADAAEPVENAFTYKLNDNTKAKNYEIVTEKGKVAMTRRPIALTAPTKSKTYDGKALTFDESEIGVGLSAPVAEDGDGTVMPEGEHFTFSNFASITEAGQIAATFSIADGTALMDDYDITVTPGATLTVMKSATEITVTAKSKSWTYDGKPHELHEYDATNLNILQPGEELVVTFKEASKVATPKDGPGEDGKVANEIESIRVVKNGSQDVTDNYTVTPYPGLLTVTKRPVTVTVEGETVSATYDGEEHTASGYDIATEDELYDIAAKTSFGGTDEVTRTDAGKSEMGLKPSDFTNSDEYFGVTYAVTDGWVDIEAADISAGTEQDFAITLGENPKYNGTVQTIPVTAVTYKGLPVTYTLAGENATHAGTYTLTVKANGNFKGERSTTWKILKRQVKLTSGSASRAYNGQPLVNGDVTVSGDGFIGVEGATYSVTGSQTLAGSSKNAFTYTLKAGTQEGDYDIEKVEGDLTVTKAKYPGQEEGGSGIQWNVAADAATWMYDGQPHGVTLTGVPSGVTPHLTGNAAKDVGEYTASVTFDFDAANYEPPKAPAPLKWTITQRPLSLQTVNAEKPYDGFPLTVDPANITPGLRGYAEGECFDYYDLASITEVGETPATFKYRDSASAKVSNYAVSVIGDATLKITVGGDQISVTARDGIWGYDGQEHRKPEWDIVNGDKLLPGHEFQIKISEDSVIGTPKDGPEQDGVVSNTFEYVKIIETKSGADKTKNYNLFVYDGILKMTNACVSAEQLKGAGDIEKVYDGKPTNVTVVAALLQPATVRYGESTDEILSTTEPEFTDAGEYVVWYTVAAQYYNTYTNKVEVRIDKRPITLTSPTKTKPFDGTALTFDGGEIEVNLTAPVAEGGDGTVLPDGESLVFSDFASITDAGRVDATFKYAAGTDTSLDNYEVTVQKGTLTVSASAEEITLTAKTGEWPYDGETHVLHEYEIENENVLKDGDILVVEYDTSSAVDTPDDGEVENRIVSFKVMRGGEEGEDVTRNYSIVTYPGKIKVVNATMTAEQVKVTSDECVYDGEGHTIEVEAIGLLTSPATVAYSESGEPPWKLDPMAVAVKNAGTHTIRYRVSSKFYNDYFGEATVKINPRKVTLLSSGAAKVFDGTPLRKNEVKVKAGSLDFVEGEGVTATCTSAQTGVGKIENGFNYEFNEGTLKDNYAIIPEFGWLEVTPGTLSVDIEKSSYNGVYDGQPHSVSPVFSGTGLNLENCEVTYALVSGDESAYTPELPTFTDVGTYTVYVKIKAQNFEVVYTEMTVTITKATVETPVIPSKVYNGEIQTADVPPSELYTIYSNEGGKEVGEHSVALKLKDSKNYKWAPKDGVTIASSYAFMTFVITKGNNEWKVEPSIESWREDEEAKLPKAEAKYGKVTVEYKGTLKSGAAYSSPFSPMNPGSYVAMFTVAETEEYDGLYKEVPFTVTEKTVEPINVKAMGFLGIYDGKPHSITVTVTGGDGTPTITYATSEDGTYGATNPSFVEIGVYTVWYKVEFPNFAPIKGSAAVSISKGSGGCEQTATTPVPVPFSWLDKYVTKFGGGDYEKAGNAKGANGVALWESYVAGLDPEDPKSQFKVMISIGANGTPVVSWEPALNGNRVKTGERTYRVFGKVNLTDEDWQPDVDETTGEYRFFKVTVSLP